MNNDTNGLLHQWDGHYGMLRSRGERFRFYKIDIYLGISGRRVLDTERIIWFEADVTTGRAYHLIDAKTFIKKYHASSHYNYDELRTIAYDHLNRQPWSRIKDRHTPQPVQPTPVITAEMLFEVVRRGDVAALRSLLPYVASPDFRDGYNNTPLMWAVNSGFLEIVRLLLNAGANPWLENQGEVSAIYLAERMRSPAFSLLVEKGRFANRPTPNHSRSSLFKEETPTQCLILSEGPRYIAKTSPVKDALEGSQASDGSYGWGWDFREGGQFGSFPGFDDYGDESKP